MISMARQKRIAHRVDEADIENNVRKRYPDNREKRENLYRFATTFNDLLEAKGVDQVKLAEDLTIASGTISEYRNGQTEPKLNNLIAIANYLGVDCRFLMTGVQSEYVASANYTGLCNDALSNLHALTEKANQEKKAGWLSLEELELTAINAILGSGFDSNLFLHIYNYLYISYSQFGILPEGASSDDMEVYDKDVSVYGRRIGDINGQQAELMFSADEMDDLALVKIQTALRKLRKQIEDRYKPK